MRPLLTPKQMAATDAATIAAGTPGAVLMERAGRAVAASALRVMGGRYGKRALVVCGKGNNGGDGFVAARILMHEGVRVTCAFIGDADEVAGDAAGHRDLFLRSGGKVVPLSKSALESADVVIDALFGTGFRGDVTGAAAEAIEAINESSVSVVAVDIPSGVNGMSGKVETLAVQADVTVVMAAEKTGTASGAGAVHAGKVEVADIGIDLDRAFEQGIGIEGEGAWVAEPADVAKILPVPSVDSHKRSRGSVALLGGSEGMSGAVILAARGAVRMGAGYATVGTTRSVEAIVSEALPEVLTSVLTDESHLGRDCLGAFKPVLERATSLAIGPGLGRGRDQQELVKAVTSEIDLPLVIDADGLNAMVDTSIDITSRKTPPILTPHPAELARLQETTIEEIQGFRLNAAREAAVDKESIVVLKGFRTVVAHPDGRVVVLPTGSSHLATAGTGDVLTGAIAALLAAGVDPFEAAWAAAYVHGLAGDLAAERVGGRGAVAWDVAEALPLAIAQVEEAK
jgi:ADP-dependent NAD(P)H-hydrate dehydratase / NAD(P)H-hydrate epimerase